MVQFESNVKHVPYSQERVYGKLEDLNNLALLKERLEQMREKLGDKIQDVTFDRDSLTLTVQGMNVTLRIIEREPCKCIKFEGEKSPIPMNLWIQILPVSEDQAKMKVTVRAQDRHGAWFEVKGKELFARALCHEIDHLDGVLFMDRAKEQETKGTPVKVRKIPKVHD